MKIRLVLMTFALLATTSVATAHNGRRFEIQIMDDQLVAQGYLSGDNPSDDGGGFVRPYLNAIHNHWGNVGPVATATLPGFDLFTPGGLLGADFTLTLTGAGKWFDPTNNVHGGGHASHSGGHTGQSGTPILTSLDASETMFIGFGNQTPIDTDSLSNPNAPNSFRIAENISGSVSDIDLEYSILINPINTLYYLQWQLGTDAPGIADSEPIYTIFAPDPSATSGLHHFALALESHLGISTVPEPSATVMLILGTCGIVARRRR